MRRMAAALAAVVLVAGSCGGGSENEEAGGGGGGTPDTFLLVPQDGDSGSGATPGGGGSGGARGGSSDTTAPPDGGGDGGGDPGGDSGDGSGGGGGSTRVMDDRGRVGSMGPALLSSDVGEVVVEVDASTGQSLTGQSRSALQRQLEDHGNKNVSTASGSQLPDQGVWTTAQLRESMEANRASWSANRRAAVYVMVLSGRHENANVVGVSFNASSFALFPDQLGGGLLGLNYPNYEEAVVVHELGHLFGLVNLTGQGAFHEDPQNQGHSANPDSVMYWAVESTVVTEVFEGGPPRDFDDADLQEMDAIRG